ncbi:winged helix-turn-helix domain-containing protein [Streptomyces sp. NPDC004667]|uniref:GntR family transcriptional regulator n=1 Tax=Streptomyces sp. NPDC004667 TaxID=3154285 RepID=UPI0033A3C19A
MTLPLDRDHRPPYVQVAEYLRRQIESGELGPGDKLPSSRELQEKFGIASATVQNALRALKTEGLIYSVSGRGSFVRRHEADPEGGQAEGGASTDTPPKPADDRYFRLAMEVEELKHDMTIMRTTLQNLLELTQQMAKHIDAKA